MTPFYSGLNLGPVALKFGGLMMEENVVSSAGAGFRVTLDEMRRLIAEMGYEARQRDNGYRVLSWNQNGCVREIRFTPRQQ